jgi:hypothetical protein
MEFGITEELATSLLMRKINAVADLHKEVEMVSQYPNIPTQNLSFRRTKSASSLITNDAKNADRNWTIYYYLINHKNIHANISV